MKNKEIISKLIAALNKCKIIVRVSVIILIPTFETFGNYIDEFRLVIKSNLLLCLNWAMLLIENKHKLFGM